MTRLPLADADVVTTDAAEHLLSSPEDNEFTPTTFPGCGCVPVLREEPARAPQPISPARLLTAEEVPRQRTSSSGESAAG